MEKIITISEVMNFITEAMNRRIPMQLVCSSYLHVYLKDNSNHKWIDFGIINNNLITVSLYYKSINVNCTDKEMLQYKTLIEDVKSYTNNMLVDDFNNLLPKEDKVMDIDNLDEDD